MSKLRLFLTGLTLLLISGCASGPGAVNQGEFSFPQDGKLGVIVLTDEYPKHSRWGSTKKDSNLSQRWDVDGVVVEHLLTRLDRVELIKPTPAISAADSTVSHSLWDGRPSLRTELEADLKQLADRHGLAAILVVEPHSSHLSPLNTGPAAPAAEGYGIVSRCDFSTCFVRTLHHVLVRVYSVDPAALVGRGEHTKNMYKVWVTKKDLDPNINIQTYSRDTFTELDQIPADDMAVARDRFYGYLQQEIDSALVSAGML